MSSPLDQMGRPRTQNGGLPRAATDEGRALKQLTRDALAAAGNRTKLAAALGVGRSTISNWLAGRSLPDPGNEAKLRAYCEADHG